MAPVGMVGARVKNGLEELVAGGTALSAWASGRSSINVVLA